MNMLLEILQTAEGDKYRLLRCRAFEASGIIAVAVGKKVRRLKAHDRCDNG